MVYPVNNDEETYALTSWLCGLKVMTLPFQGGNAVFKSRQSHYNKSKNQIKTQSKKAGETKMYKILIKYPSEKITNLWQVYGSSTTSTTGETVFTEYETDNIEELKENLIKLDKTVGFENIKVVKEIDANYTVDVTENAGSDTPDGDIDVTDEPITPTDDTETVLDIPTDEHGE